MNDDYTFYSDRRKILKGTGSLVALGSLPAYLTANGEELKSTIGGLQHQIGAVLYRAEEKSSLAFAETFARAGLETIALTDDLVRQWRDGLGDKIHQTGLPVVGLTHWTDYLMVNGLAAENRKQVLMEMQHPVLQPGKENWPVELAAGFLHLPATEGRKKIQDTVEQYLANQKAIKPGELTLFSWMIG